MSHNVLRAYEWLLSTKRCGDVWIFYQLILSMYRVALDWSCLWFKNTCCCSVAQSCLTLWDPMNYSTPGSSPSPSPGVCSNSCPLSQWCHPTSITPFSCLQSFPASGSFPMSPFASGGQSIGASASVSVLPMNIQGWRIFISQENSQERESIKPRSVNAWDWTISPRWKGHFMQMSWFDLVFMMEKERRYFEIKRR